MNYEHDLHWILGADSPISSITLAKSKTTDGEALFLLGFYYCVPERRNRGIGSMLFKRVMQKIGDSNAVIAGGLNSDGRISFGS